MSQTDSRGQGDRPSFQSEIPPRPDWFPGRRDGQGQTHHVSQEPSEGKSLLWLSQWDVLVCLCLAVAILAYVAIDWFAAGRPADTPPVVERMAGAVPVFRIDVNRSTWVEFAQLDGIGPALARRIVEDRRRRGPFASVDDLDRVRGIGAKTIEQMRPFIRVAPPVAAPRRPTGRL